MKNIDGIEAIEDSSPQLLFAFIASIAFIFLRSEWAC
jgi:hypothetical protein